MCVYIRVCLSDNWFWYISKCTTQIVLSGQEGVHEESQNNVSHLSKTAVEVLECIVNVMDHLIQRRCRRENRARKEKESNGLDGVGINSSNRNFQKEKILHADKSHEYQDDDSANLILVSQSYGNSFFSTQI